uniref:HAUS augmin-like complex subunit 6 N-terminal domain-containing protein n=1 Tax=Erpetoichthys calabaricus TaxID=27687 RepID=A0A8C4TJP7_ERPCA
MDCSKDSDYLWMLLQALDFRPEQATAAIGKQGRRIELGMHMFDKPNKDAFHIVAHFLFDKLDSARTKELFRNCWPPLDKKADAEFRKTCNKWLQDISIEQGGTFPKVVASVFLSPGGPKFITFFVHFATYVLLKDIKKFSIEDKLWVPEAAGLESQCIETAKRRFKLVQRRFCEVALRQDALIREYEKKTQLLVESLRSLYAESAKYDASLSKMKTGEIQNAGNSAEKIKVVQSFWEVIKEFMSVLEKEREVVDSIIQGNVNKYVLDGTEVSIKVPRLLLERIENSPNTLEYGNVYEAGKVNYLRVLQLLNDALHILRDESLKMGSSKVELDVQQIRGQLQLYLKSLQALKVMRKKITESLPVVKESICEKEKQWDNKWEQYLKRKPFNLVAPAHPALDLLPAMAALSFEPATEAAYKTSVFSQYPAAFPESPKKGKSVTSFLDNLEIREAKNTSLKRVSFPEILTPPNRRLSSNVMHTSVDYMDSGCAHGKEQPLKTAKLPAMVSTGSRNEKSQSWKKRTQSLGNKKSEVLYKEYDNLADKFADAVTISPLSSGGKALELEDILCTLASDPFVTKKELPRTPESLLSDIRGSWRKAVEECGSPSIELSKKSSLCKSSLLDASPLPQQSKQEDALEDLLWMESGLKETASPERMNMPTLEQLTNIQGRTSSESVNYESLVKQEMSLKEPELNSEISFLSSFASFPGYLGRKLNEPGTFSFCQDNVSQHSTLSWNSTKLIDIDSSDDIVQFGIAHETLPDVYGNDSFNSSRTSDMEDGIDDKAVNGSSGIDQNCSMDVNLLLNRYESIRKLYGNADPANDAVLTETEASIQHSANINPERPELACTEKVFSLELDFLDVLTPTKDRRLTLPKLQSFSPLVDVPETLKERENDDDWS